MSKSILFFKLSIDKGSLRIYFYSVCKKTHKFLASLVKSAWEGLQVQSLFLLKCDLHIP